MNVLILVMSMLMLLAMMTYGRLESFRNFSFIDAKFTQYMQEEERRFTNEEALKRYLTSPASRLENQQGSSQNKNLASSKLSFNLFVDKEERTAHQAELAIYLNLAKNLVHFLYGDQPFYQNLENKRPGFLDEIFDELILVSNTFEEKDRLKKAKEIATIDLGDRDINEVFTKMLKGSFEELAPSESVKENGEKWQANPFKPTWGYPSLLDFITLERNKLKIRVFLASPQLLMAIYGNAAIVQDILNARYQLYRSVVNKEMDAQTASQQFKTSFESQQLPSVPSDTLDFGVSKTNPRLYNLIR